MIPDLRDENHLTITLTGAPTPYYLTTEPVGAPAARGGDRVQRRRHVDAGDASESGGGHAGSGVDDVDVNYHALAAREAKQAQCAAFCLTRRSCAFSDVAA